MLNDRFESFQKNYTGVEQDQEAYEALESYHAKGFLQKFETLSEVEVELGCKPALCKLDCIKKMKFNADTGQYTYKARILLDCKRSGGFKHGKAHPAERSATLDEVRGCLSDKGSKEDTLRGLVNDFYAASSNAPRSPQLRAGRGTIPCVTEHACVIVVQIGRLPVTQKTPFLCKGSSRYSGLCWKKFPENAPDRFLEGLLAPQGPWISM